MTSDASFVDILHHRARDEGDREAYLMLSNRGAPIGALSYAAVDERARVIAAWLQAHCAPGDRVLLVYPPGLEYVCGFMGCLYAGMVAVPAYPPTRSKTNRGTERLRAVLENAQACCCLTDAASIELAEAAFKEAARDRPVRCVATDLLDAQLATEWRRPALAGDTLAFLQYTSGSTGDPKGVMVSHGNLIENSRLIRERFEHSSESKGVIWLPPYHDMGLIGGILQPLYGGFSTILMSPVTFIQRPWLWLQAISRYRASTSGGPDFAYAQCVRQFSPQWCEGLDLSSWKVAFTGAEAIRKQTLDQFAECFAPYGFDARAFYPCYGLAEATLFVTGSQAAQGYRSMTVQAQALAANRAEPVGGADCATLDLVASGSTGQASHRILTVEPHMGLPVKNGSVGEIWVSGPSVAAGYWQDREKTEAIFAARLANGEGPFMRTGDLGFIADGELFVTGRMKDLIIIRGRNHYPQDIEATIAQSDARCAQGAIAAFAVEVEAQAEPELIVLCEAPAPDVEHVDAVFSIVNEAVARAHGLGIAHFGIVPLRSLPKTTSGKLQRSLCRTLFLQGALAQTASATKRKQTPHAGAVALAPAAPAPSQQAPALPAATLRDWMVQAVAPLANIEPSHVDVNANFFELGLDSLELVRLAGMLGAHLGREIEPALLFDYSTIATLADYLGGDVAQSRPAASPACSREPNDNRVAIVGMSCRFPGAADPSGFWALLESGASAVTEVPAARWSVDALYDPTPGREGRMSTRWGGFIDEVDLFDAEFFGIAPREASAIDPQHRLLLELAWEALEDAGIAAKDLAGSRTGAFVGISSSDYAQLQNAATELTAYSATGNAHSIAANRISYFFDFRGPSVAVDTACSSSLVALHLACRSLIDGECDVALVGGVNLMLSPALHITFSQAQMMAADGRCKAFDDSADGYVRGEGAAFFVLKRATDVRVDTDRWLATIRATAINQDGRSNGITAPNGHAQEDVMRTALARAGVEPHEVDYVEAHGTGTRLGDPVEYRAIEKVFAAPERVTPLLIGTAKTNIGHLEAAAGVAGLAKIVLSMKHGAIPPSLHFHTLNRHIAAPDARVRVCGSQAPWPRGAKPRIAGISSFGFGGTNSHAVIEEPPLPVIKAAAADPAWPAVLTLSAACDDSLRQMSGKYASSVESMSASDLVHACYTTNVGRAHLQHRLAVVATDAPTVAAQLRRFATGLPATRGAPSHGIVPRGATNLVFTFAGQGSQSPEMGRQLLDRVPVFRNAMEQCSAILEPLLATPLLSVLYGDRASQALLERTEFAQPAIVAFEYALAQLWLSLGLRPTAVIGHSLGEFTAACIAGALELEDMLALVAARGRLMQSAPHDGQMLAVSADEATVDALLARRAGNVGVAAVNAPRVVVVSGRRSEVEHLRRDLQAAGISSVPLKGEHAFHWSGLAPIAEQFERVAANVRHLAPTVTLISTLTGAPVVSASQLSGRYWAAQITKKVQFERAVQCALEQGARVFLEIGPDRTLTGLGRRCVPEQAAAAFVASARDRQVDAGSIADALAGLYVAGADVDWKALDTTGSCRRIALPNYVFHKRRFWLAAALPSGPAREPAPVPAHTGTPSYQSTPRHPMGKSESVMSRSASTPSLLVEVRAMIASLLELQVGDVDVDAPFLEMGADSLVLLNAIQAIDDKYGVTLSINQLFDETSTIRSLAAYIEAKAVISCAAAGEVVLEPAPAVVLDGHAQLDSNNALHERTAGESKLAAVIKGQLSLMSEQLKALSHAQAPVPATIGSPVAGRRSLARSVAPATADEHEGVNAAAPFAWARVTGKAQSPSNFTAWARPPVTVSEETSEARQSHLQAMIDRHVARTPRSKRQTAQSRAALADNRASAGFRLSTKEMLYPIIGKRASGARMWDIDGNEYIDFTMGFGANLFGHSPDFIVDALSRQLADGFQIGPQSELAGAVASKIAAMTGQQRVAFCNSGTEAVMTAVRLARAVTRRSKIALFNDSYHGTFDGILARARIADGQLHTVPVAGGTPASFVEGEVLVLDYDDEASLDILRTHAHELAAVIVEPVQSRHPARQPRGFLAALRALTGQASAALIFDEVITGFRAAPGGAQAYFGIEADIATYGKVIGGGMPIGVIAGKARFMDAIDGGVWSYGDASYPRVEQTFFAGTFNKHPLTMSAALAVLERLEQAGPALHRQLNERTAQLAARLNAYFIEEDVPLRVEHFSSLFRFMFAGNMDLFFYGLLARGIYIWEGRNCFLSTAHEPDDLDHFVQAIKDTVKELRAGGHWQERERESSSVATEPPPIEVALNAAQRRFAACIASGEAPVCNIPFSLRLTGALDLPALQACFDEVVSRHDALRAEFDLDRFVQRLAMSAPLAIESIDLRHLAEAERAAAVERWKLTEVARPFELTKAPLLRVTVLRLGEHDHVLHLTVHHLVCDGMSLAIVIDEVSRLYTARQTEQALRLPPALSFAEYERRRSDDASASRVEAEAYWNEKIVGANRVRLPAGTGETPAGGAAAGERVRMKADSALSDAIRSFARTHQCTPFMVLFAAFQVLLFERTGERNFSIGVPAASRSTRANEVLVGNFVNLLPINCTTASALSFEHVLGATKRELLSGYRYAQYPCPLVSEDGVICATFNMEPRIMPPCFGELEVALDESPIAHVEFDAMLNVTETQSQLVIDLDFRNRVLDRASARQWLADYEAIMQRIAAQAGRWTVGCNAGALS